MTEPERVEALRLIERALTVIQAHYNPGRTEFMALDRLYRDAGATRHAISASALAGSQPVHGEQ